MKHWASLLLAASALMHMPLAAASESVEAKIKAAYLFNFTKFAEWPALAQSAPNAPFRICVFGSETLSKLLGELSNREINGHPLQIESGFESNGKKMTGCHLLFIDRSAELRFAPYAEQFVKSDVLTVSDIPGFAQKSGVIGFVSDAGRIRIEINLRRAREARLNISAKLLEVATIVE